MYEAIVRYPINGAASKEKIMSKYVNLAFLQTTISLPNEFKIFSVVLLFLVKVSVYKILKTRNIIANTASIKKSIFHVVYFKTKAPSTGATIGAKTDTV